ncbi:MAG: 2-dehydropantoate 2-reductase [Clostridia bacterium]|nr:2-dehydropantoate 2-reductase [Clostridia bacterium]
MFNEKAKIAIYGAGAMGTVLGAFLCRSGVNVTLVCRNQEHVNALKKSGAIVRYMENGEEKYICAPVNACLPEEMGEGYDLVFLMTKQRQNAEIAKFLQGKLAENGVVCTTQNGLPEEKLSQILGKERTYGAALTWGANRTADGEATLTSQLSAMSLSLGGYQNDNSKSAEIAAVLEPVSTVCKNPNFVSVSENLAGARWSKLCINAAFSGLSVVTGLTFGEIAKKPKTRRLALAILRECFKTASACGVVLEPLQGHDMAKLLGGERGIKKVFSWFILPVAIKRHARLKSGMLKDIENGKRCEIDFIDGAVADLAKQHGVETPTIDKLVEIVHGIEDGLYEITPKNADFF